MLLILIESGLANNRKVEITINVLSLNELILYIPSYFNLFELLFVCIFIYSIFELPTFLIVGAVIVLALASS